MTLGAALLALRNARTMSISGMPLLRQFYGSQATSDHIEAIFGDNASVAQALHAATAGAFGAYSRYQLESQVPPWTINARQGLGRIPGPDDAAYPAILHGGERVLTAPQTRQMDSGGAPTISIVLNISAVSDQGLIDLIQKKALPMIRADIKDILTRESRFGTWSIDNRAVRTVLTS